MMHNGFSGVCKPSVQVGLHGRVHVALGNNAGSLVGTREEMQAFALSLLTACGQPERFIEGELQSGNEDIHPREATA